MPTYEYACQACDHKFEEFQSIMAKPTVVCPKCGKRKVKRLISAGAGFIFKGSGFYITDYRSDAYKSSAKADGKSAASIATANSTATAPTSTTASTTAAPAESKPAPKPGSKHASSSAKKR
jgi:putative FmdB family regulatory protein